jgi:type VI protein secretion system component VasA
MPSVLSPAETVVRRPVPVRPAAKASRLRAAWRVLETLSRKYLPVTRADRLEQIAEVYDNLAWKPTEDDDD